MAIIDKIQLSGTVYTIGNETTTAVTSASTDNEIPTAKAVYDAIPQGGGGKAIEAGTNISVTTGETADTINCTLPYSKINGNGVIYDLGSNTISGKVYDSLFSGLGNSLKERNSSKSTSYNIVLGYQNKLDVYSTEYSEGNNIIIGKYNKISADTDYSIVESVVIGVSNKSKKRNQFICGYANIGNNSYETALGEKNISYINSNVFGDSGNTLFSIGNGDYFGSGIHHNALEIRQNGDIYIADTNDTSTTNYYEKPMIKLQDALGGGGGSSYTAGDGIDITNDVISVTGKVDTSAFTAHTEDTVIHVTSDEKAAWNGKQDTLVSGTNIKTINGETLLGEGNIDIQGGGVDVVQTTGTSTADVMSQDAVTNAFNEYTVRKDSDNGIVRYWSWKSPNYPYGHNSIHNFAINGRCPLSKENGVNSSIWEFNLVETSAITTSVTSSSTDSQVPSAKAVYDQFGGLKLVKLTQSEYDALATKDSSTLYIIN